MPSHQQTPKRLCHIVFLHPENQQLSCKQEMITGIKFVNAQAVPAIPKYRAEISETLI